MNHEDAAGAGPLFSERATPSAIAQVLRALSEVWPELGTPERRTAGDGAGFYAFCGMEGVEVRVGAREEDVTKLGLQVLPKGDYINLPRLTKLKADLKKRWELSPERVDEGDSLRATASIPADELGGTREVVLREDLKLIRAWAVEVCPATTLQFDEQAEAKRYEKFEGILAPVIPWMCEGSAGDQLRDWCVEIADLLNSGVSVGLSAETSVEQDLALAASAECLHRVCGRTLGRVTRSALDAERLAQLADKAPGVVATPARIVQMGSNPHQLGSETQNLLACLSAKGQAGIFFGAYSELQQVFHGGQGAVDDPLQPAVCRLPELPLQAIIAFAAASECRKANATGAQFQSDVAREVAAALNSVHPDKACRLVGQTTAYLVSAKLSGATLRAPQTIVTSLDARSETFGGLSRRPRARRPAALQRHFMERLTDPGLLSFLQSRILGQEEALRELHQKWVKEIMTRPLHQPLRFASLGEPATGKSLSMELLAEWLDIPYVNIDVASLSDPHMAMTQLLGSGPGYVGSDQSGRLESIARHHEGASLEVSDMDHASPQVRSAVGDLFLQLLETGEAQSGKGHMFSCANLIIGYTLNLPDGKDERMYDRMGFGPSRSRYEARKDIRRELKNLVSGAFWSRVGDPVLFTSLTGEVRIEIIRRALGDGACTGLERFGVANPEVTVGCSVAERVLEVSGGAGAGFGARGLLEVARGHAAQAVVSLAGGSVNPVGPGFELVWNDADALVLRETK